MFKYDPVVVTAREKVTIGHRLVRTTEVFYDTALNETNESELR